MKEKNVIHTHTHTHTHTQWNIIQPQKKEILPFATTWMKFEGIMLSDISQKEKEKYCMVFLYVESLEKKRELNS